MKTKVLDLLKNPPKNLSEKFNSAMDLASKSQLPQQFLRRFNKAGATQRNVESILYELQKFYGITAVQIVKHEISQPEDILEDDGPQLRTTASLSEVQKDPFHNILREMDKGAKEGLRFRTQYPFLQEKEVPNEFKILAADAISSFDNYKEKHQELFDALVNVAEPALTNEEVFAIANELLEDFEENREIHAEMEHFQKTGKILGEHKIFADLKLEREVAAIPPAKLGSVKANITANISKKNKALDIAKTKEDKDKYSAEIKALEAKRDLINARITEAENSETK